jgi:hypothetical protein
MTDLLVPAHVSNRILDLHMLKDNSENTWRVEERDKWRTRVEAGEITPFL